jgi:hypothetical protein
MNRELSASGKGFALLLFAGVSFVFWVALGYLLW